MDYKQVNQKNFVKIFVNKKNFVITAPKVASRFLHHVFGHNSIEAFLPNEINSKEDLKLSFYPQLDFTIKDGSFEEHCNTVLVDWENIIHKKSNKKFIVLYRNPIERFKSAVIQDIQSSFDNMKDYHKFVWLKTIILNGGFDEEITMNFILNFLPLHENKIQIDEVDNEWYFILYNQIKPVYSYLLKLYIEGVFNHNTYHYTNYLKFIYDLAKDELISYPTFVNIETKKNIQTIFNLSTTDNEIPKYSNSDTGKLLITEILENDLELKNKLNDYLKEDLKIYSILNTKIDGL